MKASHSWIINKSPAPAPEEDGLSFGNEIKDIFLVTHTSQGPLKVMALPDLWENKGVY